MNENVQKISYTCERCGSEVVISGKGLANIVCPVVGCKGKKVIFNVDIRRRPHNSKAWEVCPALLPVETGFHEGTILSRVYEIERFISEDVKDVSEVKSPESIAQFEEKLEEKPKKEKLPKNPLHRRLHRNNPDNAKKE